MRTVVQGFIKQSSLQPELNISAVDVDDREADQKKGTADMTDRYYKAEEYKKLSYEQNTTAVDPPKKSLKVNF